jgi:hypothetical protein
MSDVGGLLEKALWTGRSTVHFFERRRQSVIYSAKAVLARFSQPSILTSYAVRQHTQPMTGSPLYERQRRVYQYGEDDGR